MKNALRNGYVIAALIGASCFAPISPVRAADEDRRGPDERFERIERRLNELAERQEQMLRRFGAVEERQGPMRPPRSGVVRGQPIGPDAEAGALPPGGPREPLLAKALDNLGNALRLCFLAGLFCNVLLAVWIFSDIRKRGEGSGLFVAMALVAGIPAAVIYALVRLGDRKPAS